MTKRARKHACWWCEEEFETVAAHAVHVATCPLRGTKREVHCHACAAPLDLNRTTECPSCGQTYIERS